MSRKKQNGYHIQNGGLNIIFRHWSFLLVYCFKNVASNFKIGCKQITFKLTRLTF